MDFLVIYSNHSRACAELFELYPNLRENKGICADNPGMRDMVLSDLKIGAVPALIVVDDEKILQRVIGVDRIRNWLWMIGNEVNAVAAPPAEETYPPAAASVVDFEDNLMPPAPPVESLPQIETKALKPAAGTVKSLAEEMQREREKQMNSLNGKVN